jgi:hypothetical protein
MAGWPKWRVGLPAIFFWRVGIILYALFLSICIVVIAHLNSSYKIMVGIFLYTLFIVASPIYFHFKPKARLRNYMVRLEDPPSVSPNVMPTSIQQTSIADWTSVIPIGFSFEAMRNDLEEIIDQSGLGYMTAHEEAETEETARIRQDELTRRVQQAAERVPYAGNSPYNPKKFLISVQVPALIVSLRKGQRKIKISKKT